MSARTSTNDPAFVEWGNRRAERITELLKRRPLPPLSMFASNSPRAREFADLVKVLDRELPAP